MKRVILFCMLLINFALPLFAMQQEQDTELSEVVVATQPVAPDTGEYNCCGAHLKSALTGEGVRGCFKAGVRENDINCCGKKCTYKDPYCQVMCPICCILIAPLATLCIIAATVNAVS